MIMKTYFVLILSLFIFKSTQAIQCHVCAHRTGVVDEELSDAERQFVDTSCKKGNIPGNNFLVNCSSSNNSSLEVSCARMNIKGFTAPWPVDVDITTRGCLKFPTGFGEGCKDWRKSEILNSTDMPSKIKEYLKPFSESITVEFCMCRQSGCL